MSTIKIFGNINNIETFFCEALAQKIAAVASGIKIDFSATLEVDFLLKLEQYSKNSTESFRHYKNDYIVLYKDKIIGDHAAFVELARSEFNIDDAEVTNTIIGNRQVREGTYRLMAERGHPLVYIEFVNKSATRPAEARDYGKVYIELFTDLCPKACENFLKLCEGTLVPGKEEVLHYVNSPVHRIVKDGWIQCGDIVDGTGLNSIAAVDATGTVADESFSVDFGFAPGGIVGFANSGPHCNGSQFFLTTGPCPWMNSNFVGFGRVVQGFSILRHMNRVPTNNQRPSISIVIGSCGAAPEK